MLGKNILACEKKHITHRHSTQTHTHTHMETHTYTHTHTFGCLRKSITKDLFIWLTTTP